MVSDLRAGLNWVSPTYQLVIEFGEITVGRAGRYGYQAFLRGFSVRRSYFLVWILRIFGRPAMSWFRPVLPLGCRPRR